MSYPPTTISLFGLSENRDFRLTTDGCPSFWASVLPPARALPAVVGAVRKLTTTDHQLFPLKWWSPGITDLSAILASRRASSVSLLDTILLGGGLSFASIAHAQPQLPDVAIKPSLIPFLDGSFPTSFSSCKRKACNCVRFRRVSFFARSKFRFRSFSIDLYAQANFLSNLAEPWMYRRIASSDNTPIMSPGTCMASSSFSGSKGLIMPRVDTLSRIMTSFHDGNSYRKVQEGGIPL